MTDAFCKVTFVDFFSEVINIFRAKYSNYVTSYGKNCNVCQVNQKLIESGKHFCNTILCRTQTKKVRHSSSVCVRIV